MRSHHREGLSLESSAVLSLGIVDYDPLALYALRDLVLRSSERVRLLWSVRSRCAALRRLVAVEPVPDVILIDSELSDDSGRTAPLAREASEAGAAVVAMSASGVEGEAAVRSDADGSHGSRAVVPKETLLLGGGVIWRVLQRVAASEIGDVDKAAVPPMARPLSDKERYVIELYALGLTTQSVAHRMSVAESTVKTYARRAYKKLGVGSRAEAVAVLARQSAL
jgi:probable transcriptional regulatory protein narL